jgi:hypothetical protein
MSPKKKQKQGRQQALTEAQRAERVCGICRVLFQGSKDVPWGTQATGGVVGLTVLQPKFLEQFPDARFHFKGPLAQRGTFKDVWLHEERTVWALERLEE